jgi:hypothetical protein
MSPKRKPELHAADSESKKKLHVDKKAEGPDNGGGDDAALFRPLLRLDSFPWRALDAQLDAEATDYLCDLGLRVFEWLVTALATPERLTVRVKPPFRFGVFGNGVGGGFAFGGGAAPPAPAPVVNAPPSAPAAATAAGALPLNAASIEHAVTCVLPGDLQKHALDTVRGTLQMWKQEDEKPKQPQKGEQKETATLQSQAVMCEQ